MSKFYIGMEVENKRGHKGVITEIDHEILTIKFECGFIGCFQKKSVRDNSFRSPNEKTYCGVGFIGEGIRGTKTDEKAYRYWRSMFDYSYGRLSHRAAVPLTVSNEFHNFQKFADFVEKNVGAEAYANDSYAIQKDRFEPVYSRYSVMCVAK